MKLFLSYAWTDQKYADQVDSDLTKIGIDVIRDVRDLEDNKSLKEFMANAIKQSRYVVILLSDSYLKSKNCMYEALRLYQQDDYLDKIISVVLSDACYIYDPIERTQVVKYWIEKFNTLDEKVRELPIQKNQELLSELEVFDEISRMAGNFCSKVSDTKNSTISELRNRNYKLWN